MELRLRPARPDEIELMASIDDDAGALFAQSGLSIQLPPDDPFVQLERVRWLAAAYDQRALFALDAKDEALALMVLGHVDGLPYLEQLSVRMCAMRQGLGRALLAHACDWAAPVGELWLTTYAQLPFNRPFYERAGFVTVPEDQVGPELRELLESQRRTLPAPEQRVAMVWTRAPRKE